MAEICSDILSRAGISDENSIETPLELNVKLQTTYANPLPDPTRYYQVVGSLYVIITRAGTCFAAQNLSSLLLHL